MPATRLIAIDPGDRWTGVAFFTTDEDGNWYCQDAQEFDPPEFEDALAEALLGKEDLPPEYVVFEKWRLYADKAKEQTGSEFLASQHIGVIKYLCRIHNQHVDLHIAADQQGRLTSCQLPGGPCNDPEVAKRVLAVRVEKQPADIKKPVTGILRKKKIKSVAKPIAKAEYGGRDHIVDAELHGWYFILKTLDGSPATT